MPPTPSRNGHSPNGSSPHPVPRFAPPSPNGVNGGAGSGPPSPNGVNGRDSRGRFAKGNRGGTGNPFARRVARLRTLLLEIVSEDDLRGVLAKLVERARTGDVAAVRLVLNYLIGRPVDAVDPDRLDLEEWRLYKEGPTIDEVLDGPESQPDHLHPGMACVLARSCQNQNRDEMLTLMTQSRDGEKTEGEGGRQACDAKE
jgi:hypothetical protein